ncbi:MAG TPA: DUF2207 domain-containing protein [Propionibacteriaceae bacterium]|nr:DUF2207 domain-containing protein [Propionibacteriaceae bacterium]
MHRPALVLAVCLGVLGLLSGPLSLTARAEGTASRFVADGNLGPDGVLRVKQTITFAGAAPARLSQRFETRQNLIGDRQYVYSLTDVTATAEGKDLQPTVDPAGSITTVSMSTNGASEITMSYSVTGAVVSIDGGTALRWPLLQGLSAQVTDFSGTVAIPGLFSYVKCTAGAPNSTTPCEYAAAGTDDAQVPTFRDGPRGEGQVVIVDIGFPPGAVTATEKIDHRWTVSRAFSAGPWQLALALGLLLLGGLGLYALHRRAGADSHPGDRISRPAEFVPTGPGESEFRVVGDVRPGHVGTVLDERVDPIDITATLLDLAVRGHLVIVERPRASEFAPTDWSIVRQTSGVDTLRPFEQELMDGIAPVGGSVEVSEIAGRVGAAIGAVQDKLYDEMVSNGWYERRPDATRSKWTQLAIGGLIAAVVVTAVLAAFTTFGLVGLALVVIGLGLVFVGQEMPARTASGSALLAGLSALRSDLLTHPTTQMPARHRLRELSEVLPYAVVLGGSDRWLNAIVAADVDEDADSTDLDWYHGPRHWHLRDLPASLRNFITTVSGSLFTR